MEKTKNGHDAVFLLSLKWLLLFLIFSKRKNEAVFFTLKVISCGGPFCFSWWRCFSDCSFCTSGSISLHVLSCLDHACFVSFCQSSQPFVVKRFESVLLKLSPLAGRRAQSHHGWWSSLLLTKWRGGVARHQVTSIHFFVHVHWMLLHRSQLDKCFAILKLVCLCWHGNTFKEGFKSLASVTGNAGNATCHLSASKNTLLRNTMIFLVLHVISHHLSFFQQGSSHSFTLHQHNGQQKPKNCIQFFTCGTQWTLSIWHTQCHSTQVSWVPSADPFVAQKMFGVGISCFDVGDWQGLIQAHWRCMTRIKPAKPFVSEHYMISLNKSQLSISASTMSPLGPQNVKAPCPDSCKVWRRNNSKIQAKGVVICNSVIFFNKISAAVDPSNSN